MVDQSKVALRQSLSQESQFKHNNGNSRQQKEITSYEQEGGLDLGLLLETLRRRFLLILGSMSVFTVGTILWSATRPPTYISKFQILIEPVTAESEVVQSVTGKSTSVAGQDLGVTQQSNAVLDYPTQIEVLLSRQILEKVIDDLQPRFPDLNYSYLRNNLLITRVESDSVQGATKILEVTYDSSTPEETQDVMGLVSQSYLTYSVTERQTNLKRAIQFTDRQLPVLTSQVKTIEESLQKFRESNQILEPKQTTEQVSKQLANIDEQISTNQVQLAKQRELYTSLERQVQLQPNSAEAGAVLSEAPEYQTLTQQLQTVETQLAVSLGELSEDHPTVISLKDQRDRLIPLVSAAAQNVLGDNLAASIPNLDGIPYQTSLRRNLSQQLIQTSLDINVLEVEAQKLNIKKKQLEQMILVLPRLTREHDALQRQLMIASNNLEQFLEKREELLINSARQEVPWELIEPPQEASAEILTSLPRDIAIGALLGLLMGIGISILLDKNSNIIYSLQELRDHSKLPVLGFIPLEKDLERAETDVLPEYLAISLNQEIDIQDESSLGDSSRTRFSAFREAFKSLNLQIRLMDPDHPIRSVVISSTAPSEGKTTVAIHLAQAAAAMGQNVLLVDTDFSLPSIGKYLNLGDTIGLADYLSSDRQDISSFIQTMHYEQNFSVLVAGSQVTDSARVLSSHRMRSLMAKLHNLYDLIIYDTPPLGITDPAIITPRTDGLLLVAKMGVVKQTLLREMLHSLEIASLPLLGIVANGVKKSPLSYHHYSQYGYND